MPFKRNSNAKQVDLDTEKTEKILSKGYSEAQFLEFVRDKSVKKLGHMNDGEAKNRVICTLVQGEIDYSLEHALEEISHQAQASGQKDRLDRIHAEREQRILQWIEHFSKDNSKNNPFNEVFDENDESCLLDAPIDMFGNTRLHIACEDGNIEETSKLINEGANIDLKNNAGKKPIDKAGESIDRIDSGENKTNHFAVLQLLLKHSNQELKALR